MSEMYEQGTDVRLLSSLLPRLPSKVVIDAGAERGGFTQAFLDHRAELVVAIEPYPPNVDALRKRFAAEPRVTILDLALGERDDTASLHLIEDRKGENTSSYHSLRARRDTEMLHTVGQLTVSCRALSSLLEEGAFPRKVGILKIDAEGHDFGILRGLGALAPLVVMIEFWDDLPGGVGERLFSLADVDAFMKARGYHHVAVVKRYEGFETIWIDDVRTRPGDWGNAIFLHESAFSRMPVEISQAAADAHVELIDKAVFFRKECGLRLQVIEEQARALDAHNTEAARWKAAPIGERVKQALRGTKRRFPA